MVPSAAQPPSRPDAVRLSQDRKGVPAVRMESGSGFAQEVPDLSALGSGLRRRRILHYGDGSHPERRPPAVISGPGDRVALGRDISDRKSLDDRKSAPRIAQLGGGLLPQWVALEDELQPRVEAYEQSRRKLLLELAQLGTSATEGAAVALIAHLAGISPLAAGLAASLVSAASAEVLIGVGCLRTPEDVGRAALVPTAAAVAAGAGVSMMPEYGMDPATAALVVQTAARLEVIVRELCGHGQR